MVIKKPQTQGEMVLKAIFRISNRRHVLISERQKFTTMEEILEFLENLKHQVQRELQEVEIK
jgi:hypothetical protein